MITLLGWEEAQVTTDLKTMPGLAAAEYTTVHNGLNHMTEKPGLEYVACSLCGSNESALLMRIPTPDSHLGTLALDVWDAVRCLRCGLVYICPRPDAAAQANFYTFDNIADRAFVEEWFVECAAVQRSTFRRFLRAMRAYGSSGRLLDVGCGAGTFVDEARLAGYDSCGQDVSPWFVRYCRSHYGFDVYAGDLDDLRLPASSFDCVTAFDVIEHHPEPKQLLMEMHRLLKPRGLAVISTHDIGNWLARIHGSQWRYLHPLHLTYFTRKTLSQMLQSCGFQVLRCGGLHTFHANWVVERINFALQFFKVIVLRTLILSSYRPIVMRFPALSHWRLEFGSFLLTNESLLRRAGTQVNMDDDMIIFALAQ